MSIWAATTCIYVFGFFHFKVSGEDALLFWFIIGLVLASAPVSATKAIWGKKSSSAGETPRLK